MIMNFDTVIATRNRAVALALTLPLHLSQSRLPGQIIVVDSSDDPTAAREVVEAHAANAPVPVRFVHVAEPSLTHQRNVGLDLVSAEVTFFPDDDSVCYPGTTDAIMRVYERDREEMIAGVCARPMPTPPDPALLAGTYEMSAAHRTIMARSGRFRKVEQAFGDLNPMTYLAGRLARARPAISWLADEECVAVPWMTGFRMSFRTDAIRSVGFEPAFQGYAMYEDFDAGFCVAQGAVLVATHRAWIFHHRFPSGRPVGFSYGVHSILNSGYVLAKHADLNAFTPPDKIRLERKLRQFTLLRSLEYRRRALRDRGAGEIRKGMIAALTRIADIFTTDATRRASVYRTAVEDLIPTTLT